MYRSSFTRKDKLQGLCFQLGRPGRRAAGGSAARRPMHPRLITFHVGKFDQRVINLHVGGEGDVLIDTL